MNNNTLGARLALRDEEAFVGRAGELRLLESLFVPDPPVNVAFVHGPGGIGKSALLREARRRGAAAGWTPFEVEGRELQPVPDALSEALTGAATVERPLILIDSYERMAALGGHLRRSLLPALPDATIVVIAGRRPPETGWSDGGWRQLVVEVQLDPLEPAESLSLLTRHGVADAERATELAHWAAGSPLALTLAADAAVADPDWSPARSGEPPELVRALMRRLAESELDAVHRDVLAVAAIARSTTAPLLRGVLGGIDAAEALAWLRSRTFSEPLGDGVILHDLVRRAVRADLRLREPERERELRRLIADDLHARAAAGEPQLTIDLAQLAESPQVRGFYGWEGAVRNRLDGVRPGDAEQVALLLAARGDGERWERTRHLFEDAPQQIVVARDAADRLCGYSIAATHGTDVPAAVVTDPLLGPWLEQSRPADLLFRDVVDFTDDPESGVRGMLTMVWVLRSGLPNPRRLWLPVDPLHDGALRVATAIGAIHAPELDALVSGRRIECHLVDYGDAGLLGAQRALVYSELGLPSPVVGPGPAGRPATPADPGAVRDALRSLQVPARLARNPLARGETVSERATHVRALIEHGVREAFGEGEDERLLARVLERGYLDPAPSHEVAADELCLSRAAYFRRLKAASERVAECVMQRI